MPDEVITQEAEQVKPTALTVQKTPPMREMLTVLKDTGDPELFKAFAKDIIQREIARARFGEDSQLAMVFASSGAFDGIDGSERGVSLAMTKIQMGRSWNMEPADAMECVFFINGRPSVATKYLSAKMQDAGIAWDIEWDRDDKETCTGCHLHLKRWDPGTNRYEPIKERINGTERQAVVSFTKKHADVAQVHEKGKMIKLSEKWNFQSWSEDMYFARCVSRVRTRYCPNILSGVLTREEAEDSLPANAVPLAIAAARETATVERAATATAAKQTAIAEQLATRTTTSGAPVPETPAEELKRGPVPNNAAGLPVHPPQPLWHDKQSLQALLMAEMQRIGKPAFDEVVSRHGMISKLTWDNPKTVGFYEDLKKTAAPGQPAAAIATGPEPAAQKLPEMSDDF